MEGSSLTLEQKLKLAEELKTQGNQHFKNKQYTKALGAYHKANLYVSGIENVDSPYYSYSKDKLDNEMSTQLKDIQFSIYMNMAQVYILQQKYEKSLNILQKAATIKETPKLLYRRATAYMYSDKFKEAREDIQKIKQQDSPGDAAIDIQSKLTELKSLEKKYDQKLSNTFKKMFI